MNEKNNGKLNENAMKGQEQWKDQDERRKQWENGQKNNGRSETMEGSKVRKK
jgi:hypothetical protein